MKFLTLRTPDLLCLSACLAAGMGVGVTASSETPAGWNFEHMPATPQPLPAAPTATSASVSSASSSSARHTPASLFADVHQQPGPAALALPGLRNETGEYNCFLNVIIQCLWRCTTFRQQVRQGRMETAASAGVHSALWCTWAQAELTGSFCNPLPAYRCWPGLLPSSSRTRL